MNSDLTPTQRMGLLQRSTEGLSGSSPQPANWRNQLQNFLGWRSAQLTVIALIVINAITLGLETSPTVMAEVGSVLIAIDRTILAIFVLEIVLRLVAYGLAFFRDPWNVFDFAVVGIALIPASGPFSVLRALRIVRVLRLISVVPRMRRVVGALLGAIPSMGSIIALLSLLMYVGAVMATKLYGSSFPELFGSLPDSLFSLFQIMTLEGWSDGIVRPVMETYPFAWLFFIPFILITTFIRLNLFIAVIVNAMQMQHEQEAEAKHAAADQEAHAERELMLAEVRAIRKDLGDLRADLERRRPS